MANMLNNIHKPSHISTLEAGFQRIINKNNDQYNNDPIIEQ